MTASTPGERLGNLPVEMRDMEFALVGRATVGTAAERLAELPDSDSSVYLSVTLPDGLTVGRAVNCGKRGPKTAHAVAALLAELPTISAFLAIEQENDLPTAKPVRAGVGLATLPGTAKEAPWSAKLYSGAGATARDPLSIATPAAPGIAVTREVGSPLSSIQLTLPNWLPVNLVLPRGATVEIRDDGEGWFVPTIMTGQAATDDLIRLRAAGRVDEVAAILKGLTPNDALDWFETHPAAAVVLGYGLLRTDPPEAIWNTFTARPALYADDPDALVIAAEVAARTGRHDAAIDHLLAASELGLPTFAFGLSYLVDRLRAFGPRPGGPELPKGTMDALSSAVDRIQPFALHQDYDMLLTCYSGADPTKPQADP